MISAVILAAGKSKRIGRDKAFLLYKGKSFLENIIIKLKKITSNLIIICGIHNSKMIKKVAKRYKAFITTNTKYNLGQIYSVKLAVKTLKRKKIKMPLIIHLIDQPHIKEETYHKLIKAYWKNRCIIVPRYYIKEEKRYKRGHPIIIPPKYFKLLLKNPYNEGLHWLIHHKSVKVKDVSVEDKTVIEDIDTQDDYIRLTNTR